LRLFSFGGNGLALAALALVVFGAIECPPLISNFFFWWWWKSQVFQRGKLKKKIEL